jgi:hypothetical protein
MKDTGKTINEFKVYSNPENVGFKDIMYKGKPIVRDPEASIKLLYPNNTSVTIRGDGDIVKQLVNRLDGEVIEYTVKVPSHDSI